MNNLYKKIYSVIKSQPMVKYILCSVFTAFIETVLGLILVNAFSMGIVVANTIRYCNRYGCPLFSRNEICIFQPCFSIDNFSLFADFSHRVSASKMP